ncbi:hypothetical protein [Nioella sp. MMSF_3534]|uniref:hypothetical protein n=1 Tax=Nioella sp. MMSF_3534 TaxID=3046720 RepID=UPI00273FA117|nr:hypothetical protein [Nioella sp. MMSF_3534]
MSSLKTLYDASSYIDATPSGLDFFVFSDSRLIDDLVALAHVAHQESLFSEYRFSGAKVENAIKHALDNPLTHGILIAKKGDRIVGVLYCTVGDYFLSTNASMTTIRAFYVRKDERQSLGGGRASLGLLSGVESWSRARGIDRILFHVTSGVNLHTTHRLAGRAGFQMLGGNYVKTLG